MSAQTAVLVDAANSFTNTFPLTAENLSGSAVTSPFSDRFEADFLIQLDDRGYPFVKG